MIYIIIYFIFGTVLNICLTKHQDGKVTVEDIAWSFILGGIFWPFLLYYDILKPFWKKIKDKKVF